ncbi:MAG: YHS domain-containing protein [Thaumarchaeota archaeon]|nr:YHS domain-containing protein [Candidatus Wolframiiraptor allenii]
MVKDIVCGMEVGKDTPYKMEYKGKTYYFCCGYCLEEFRKNPEKYLSSKSGDDLYSCGC